MPRIKVVSWSELNELFEKESPSGSGHWANTQEDIHIRSSQTTWLDMNIGSVGLASPIALVVESSGEKEKNLPRLYRVHFGQEAARMEM